MRLKIRASIEVDEIEAYTASIGPYGSWDQIIVRVLQWLLKAKEYIEGENNAKPSKS